MLKKSSWRMIQWLAHKDFTCFIPERIDVFWTNVFFKSLVTTCMRYDVVAIFVWSVKSLSKSNFSVFDGYCRQHCLCPN